jgi:hypothetical protein
MVRQAFESARGAQATDEGTLVEADDLRSQVTFSRTHPTDCGDRQIFVRLDDQPNIALLNGQFVTQDVQPGRHVLRVNNTLFWKKREFSIEPGEHLECLVINRSRWWTAGIVGLLGSAPLFLTVRLNSLK